MESQQPEPDSVSYDEQSPYAPPASAAIDTATRRAIKEYSSPFPFRLTFFSALIATAVMGLVLYTGASGLLGGLAVYAWPFVSVACSLEFACIISRRVVRQRGQRHGKR